MKSLAVRLAAILGTAVSAVFMATALAQGTQGPEQGIIIGWKGPPSTDAAAAAAQIMRDMQARYGMSMTSMRMLPTGGEVIRMGRRMTSAEMAEILASLSRESAVQYAHEDLLLQPAQARNVGGIFAAPDPLVVTPDDTRYNEQWHLFEEVGGLDVQHGWYYSFGTNVVVAVVDTGYRPHVDLANNIVGGYDFISDPFIANDGDGRDASPLDPGDFTAAGTCGPGDPGNSSPWHGTHLAGTIAAVTSNTLGVAGIAFQAQVVPVRVLGRCGGRLSDVAEGIIWAAGGRIAGVPVNPNPAKVLTLALSAPAPCDATSQAVIDVARALGAVLVVAAGNSNIDASNSLPGNCAGVITVAATARDGGKAFYSNFGDIVDLAAPGGDTRISAANGVLSTSNSGLSAPGQDAYGYRQGTSMAAAHVAGVAALMLTLSALTPADLESRLKSSTRAFAKPCDKCGTGILSAAKAVLSALPEPGNLR